MMFQIAATTSFAIQKNTKASFPNLISHLKYLNADKTHQPDLDHSQDYLSFFKNPNKEESLINLLVIRYPFHYERKSMPAFCYVDGFFQSEKYFIDHREEVLRLFSPLESYNSILDKYSENLNQESVSIHVRRGDYLKNSNYHHNLPMGYYTAALERIKNYDKVFIFSDDIEWCKVNFPNSEKNLFIDEKDYISLLLMSRCKHNIIANSSFSWWGAWLNQHSSKKVIAPNKWFGPQTNLETKDIYPPEWIKI